MPRRTVHDGATGARVDGAVGAAAARGASRFPSRETVPAVCAIERRFVPLRRLFRRHSQAQTAAGARHQQLQTAGRTLQIGAQTRMHRRSARTRRGIIYYQLLSIIIINYYYYSV